MTSFEENMKTAQENDKIIFYDYIQYKKAVGWFTNFSEIDWNRPEQIKRAKYDANFIFNLPNYYFFGLPIKEIIKSDYSNCECHTCSIALSLCFNDFKIITCNLQNYVEYYNKNNIDYIEEFTHTILLVNLENKKVVIDTTFGIITDIQTYNYIFNMKDVNIIFSEELKKTEVYKYIEDRKLINNIKKQEKEVWEYMSLCCTYKDEHNKQLEEFINEHLLNNLNNSVVKYWIKKLEFKFEYPKESMISTNDDEFDFTLDGDKEETIKRNKIVLEKYHNEKEVEKSSKKVLSLINRLLKK